MMLTNKVLKRVELPHEPGQWIEVRMPSLLILEQARRVRSRYAIELATGIDFSAFKGLQPDGVTEQEDGAELDKQTLLSACITAWSYAEPVIAENVAELDEATVAVLVTALLHMETEESRKNGSRRSIKP